MVIPMGYKEIREAQRVRIPEMIIGKMSQGIKLNKCERSRVREMGKVYVESYKRNGKWVKPQLRNLSNGRREGLFSTLSQEEITTERDVTSMRDDELEPYLMKLQTKVDELNPKFIERMQDALKRGVSHRTSEGKEISKLGGKIDDVQGLQDDIMEEMEKRSIKIPVIRG